MPALCRLCAEESKDTTHIFSAKGCELRLADKIHKCLPVVVSRLYISLLVLRPRLRYQDGVLCAHTLYVVPPPPPVMSGRYSTGSPLSYLALLV